MKKTDHIFHMTDDTGMFQHSIYGVPNLAKGYTSDDNARALIMAVMLYDQCHTKKVESLIYRYVSFLCYAQNADGTFRNFMGYNREFLEKKGSDDCFGRCLWALCYAWASPTTPQNVKKTIEEAIEQALPHCLSLNYPRSRAYTIIGLSYLNGEKTNGIIAKLAVSLADHYEQHKDGDWHWFEDSMTYCNATLPWAMLSAYRVTQESRYQSIGFESLQFLESKTFSHGYFKPIGCNGWLDKGKEPAEFDEQPVEACEMTLVFLEAYASSGNDRYLDRAKTCFSWYLGNNSKKLSLIDTETGGCYDGITPDGLNLNQGAESVVSFWIAYLAIKSKGSNNVEINLIHQEWLDRVEDIDLKNQLFNMTEPEINEAFYKDLEFGTGGLRGIMGAGTDRMNLYTVNKATQGLCNYLISQKENSSVAIAFDSRLKSEEFARSAAGVLAANGVKVHIFAELMPTPVLSFAVRALACDAGIVITASHNPCEYNGYKVYGSDGCQITLGMAEAILKCIEKVNIFDGVRQEPFAKAAADGRIQFIAEDIVEKYLDLVGQCSINPEILKETDLKVIYSPLNGAGNKLVRETLSRAGLKNVLVVPEQEKPDGLFPTCQKPNPEEYSALIMAIGLAEEVSADLVFATDPDGDRVGVAVKSGRQYKLLTGNEIGCLLLDYILAQKKAKNSLPENPVIIKTIVTSAMTYLIAAEYGAQVIDTLTGFKYIGEQIGLLEQKHREEQYVCGFEESCGYLVETFVRDKDAISVSLLICEMTAFYKKNNLTLLEVLEKLYEKHGFWKHKLLSFSFEGAQGMEKTKVIMNQFREGYFSDYAGLSVVRTDDYLNSKSNLLLPKSDVVLLALEKESEIVLRPSGTEPKLKCYLTVKSQDNDSASQMLEAFEADVTNKINSLKVVD